MEENYREVKKAEPCLKLIHMDQVEVEEIKWLFYPFIPYGKVTIIQGDPGEGKTTVVLQIIAKLTKGEAILSETSEGKSEETGVPINVIYQTAEDGLGDTIKPRLLAAGADCSRVLVIDDQDQPLTMVDARLEEAIIQTKARLVVLDPFMLADVDFFVRMPDGTFAILECKTCNYNAKDKWADEGIPAHYVLQVRHYLSVMNMQKAFIACLYGNNENEFVYRTIERDLIEEEDIIDQETYFWQEHVLKNVVPPHNGNSDLVLANIRNYGGFADKSIPEIVLSGLESKNLEKYLTLSEEKSQLEKRKKEIEAEQRAISVPFVEQLGQGCKAVLEDGTNRYRITYNPTRRTSVGKDQMEKLKNQHPDIYEEYTKTTESRTFRIKKEAA